MTCEIFKNSTSNTSFKHLIYSFTNTEKLRMDFQTAMNNQAYDWKVFPITDSYSDFFELQAESASYQLMLATEKVLSRDWDSPEEDDAWADL